MDSNALILQAVRAAQNGEESSWGLLYQYYNPKLYAAALAICAALPESKDLVQDTFLAAYLKLSQLKDAENFEGWIRKILERNCYRVLSKNREKKKEDFGSIAASELIDDIEKRFDQPFYHSQLYKALTELPETLLSTLLLRYFSSYSSYRDIADIFSIPIGTVRSRLSEAKQKLIEKWNKPSGGNFNAFHESNTWNQFYYEVFSGAHHSETDRKKLLSHLGKNVRIVFSGGISHVGSGAFENLIIDDHKHSSWLTPVKVISCGNLSIIEIKHFNSVEHPNHCPPKSVAVLRREKSEVRKMTLHIAIS